MGARRKFCSGGGGGSEKKAPHKYKKDLSHAEKLSKWPQYVEKVAKRPQINILTKYKYICFRESSQKMYSKTQQIAQ